MTDHADPYNQPEERGDRDLWAEDPVLRVHAEGAGADAGVLDAFGRTIGTADMRQAGRDALPEIEQFLKKHHYAGAYSKLPERVNEADGQLTADLRFWDKLISQLKTFQSALVKEVATLPKDDRTIETPDGEGQLRIVTPTTFEVSLKGALKKYAWTELDPAQILDVARRAFSGKGTRFDAYALSFAFAHKLENEFWDVQLDVMSAPDKNAHEQWVTELETRFAERLK